MNRPIFRRGRSGAPAPVYSAPQKSSVNTSLSGGGYSNAIPIQTQNFFSADAAMVGWYPYATWPPSLKLSTGTVVASTQGWNYSTRVLSNRVRPYASNAWGTLATVGDNISGTDDHGVSALAEDAAGFIHELGHAHNGVIQHYYSTAAGNPGAWTRDTDLPTVNGTYPHPNYFNTAQVSNKMLVFYRETDIPNNRYQGYVVGSTGITNGVITWGSITKIIDLGADSRCYWGETMVIGNEVHAVITRADFADTLRQDVFYIRYDATNGTVYNYNKSVNVTSGNYPLSLATLQASYRILNQTDASKQGQVPCMDYNASTGEMVICMLDGLTAGNPRTVQVASITNLLTSPVLGSWTVVGNTDITCTAYAIRFRADGTLDVLFSTPSVAIPLNATSGSFGEGGDINLVSRSPAGVWGSASIIASCGRKYALSQTSKVKNGTDDFAFVWSETIGSSTTGIENGRAVRCFGWSPVGGYLTDVYSPDAVTTAYITAMSTPEPIANQKAIDVFAKLLKGSSFYSHIEELYLLMMGTQQANLIDLTARHAALSVNGSVAFTAYGGMKGDGSTGWLGNGWNPNTTPGLTGLNSIGIGAYMLENLQSDAAIIGNAGQSTPGMSIVPRAATSPAANNATLRLNDATTSVASSVTDSRGLFFGLRNGASAKFLFRNRTSLTITNPTAASTAVPNGEERFMAGLSTFNNTAMLAVIATDGTVNSDFIYMLGNALDRLALDLGVSLTQVTN